MGSDQRKTQSGNDDSKDLDPDDRKPLYSSQCMVIAFLPGIFINTLLGALVVLLHLRRR